MLAWNALEIEGKKSNVVLKKEPTKKNNKVTHTFNNCSLNTLQINCFVDFHSLLTFSGLTHLNDSKTITIAVFVLQRRKNIEFVFVPSIFRASWT